VHEEPLPDVTSRRWKAITSGGSTGRPKIIVALEPAEADPEIGIDAFGMRPGARQIVAGPLYHNGPYVSAVRGLMCGGSLVIPGRFDAANVLDTVSRRGINWMLLVPTMMLRMLRADPERGHDLTSLDAILHLGGPCPAWVKRGWIDWLGPEKVLELYGSTEGQAVTIISGTEWLDHPGSVGRPGRYVLDRGLAGSSLDARIDIWDAELQPVASGVVGEIWSKVDLDSPGYEYVGAEVRRERGWESVGDLGWKDDEGYLYIADRRIDLVVTGGANVYPAEVEAVISEHPKVRDCVVIGLPDEALGRSVHAIVEVEDGLNLSDLQEFVHERLVRYKVPRTWEVAAKLARNDAGKIRRTALVVERSEHCAKAN
jgi:bile acid-coenzyme A ligase